MLVRYIIGTITFRSMETILICIGNYSSIRCGEIWKKIDYVRGKIMKRMIVVIAVILIFIGAYFGGLLPLGINYGTGLNLDTSANFHAQEKSYQPFRGNNWIQGVDSEVIVYDKYIVSWQSGAYSQLITARASFQYHARARCEGWLCACGYAPGVVIGTYWTEVNYVEASGQTTKIIDTKNNWWDTRYVYWVRGADSSRYVSGSGHYLPNVLYDYPPGGGAWSDLQGSKWYMPWGEDDGEAKWYNVNTDTIEFKMKGSMMGGLKLTTTLKYAEKEDIGGVIPCTGFRWHRKEAKICDDETYLASGEGEITIESTNAVEIAGTETTEETQIIYTKYVYEEGLTVDISIDAGYSGASLNPSDAGYGKGWTLSIYDSKGLNRHSENIPDDVRGYSVPYTIPSGAFIINDPNANEWRVVLKNTLFDQSETRLFVIDKYEYMPGQVIITTDKSSYKQWETVQVTLEATAKEGSSISYFKAWAKYTSAGSVDYASPARNYPAQHVSGSSYKATFSFQLEKGDVYVYLRSHAIDSEGRAGVEGELKIYSEQAVEPLPNYLNLIIGILVFVLFAIIAWRFPIPFGIYGKIAIVVLGAVLAVLIYYYL